MIISTKILTIWAFSWSPLKLLPYCSHSSAWMFIWFWNSGTACQSEVGVQRKDAKKQYRSRVESVVLLCLLHPSWWVLVAVSQEQKLCLCRRADRDSNEAPSTVFFSTSILISKVAQYQMPDWQSKDLSKPNPGLLNSGAGKQVSREEPVGLGWSNPQVLLLEGSHHLKWWAQKEMWQTLWSLLRLRVCVLRRFYSSREAISQLLRVWQIRLCPQMPKVRLPSLGKEGKVIIRKLPRKTCWWGPLLCVSVAEGGGPKWVIHRNHLNSGTISRALGSRCFSIR